MRIAAINIRKVKVPLVQPYKLAYGTITEFEPIVIEAVGDTGRRGWAEAFMPRGSVFGTPETGWAFCEKQAPTFVGLSPDRAIARCYEILHDDYFAVSGFVLAFEMLADSPLLRADKDIRVPLLVPVASRDLKDIPDEIERHLDAGYKALKIKVGTDAENDLKRVECIVRAMNGRGEMTTDANRNFSRADAIWFAERLPTELSVFEQPVAPDDWDGIAAVAAVSKVPVMLDESVVDLNTIERAGEIEGVGAVKLKAKRLGGAGMSHAGIVRANELGLRVSLGDGTSTEIGCWPEVCLGGLGGVEGAGEMNGYTKCAASLFANPLAFENGEAVLPAGYYPEMDLEKLAAHTHETRRFETVGA